MSNGECVFKLSCEARSIFVGWYKYLFADSRKLIKERTDLCRRCPISKRKDGSYSGWCKVRNGGCGCHLKAKSAHKEEWCDKGVWGPDVLNEQRLNEVIEESTWS